jgi:6-phosphogluconate dehydrogenase
MEGVLKRIQSALEKEFPELRSFRFCDDQHLPEVELAVQAGVGWRGKNTLLLDRGGSSFHLGGLLLSLEGVATPPAHPDHCGSCTACLDACPTGAFLQPGMVDAGRCLSHWNIEDRESTEGPAARAARGEIFGCDICQQVCPWNRKAMTENVNPEGWPCSWEDWVDITRPGGGFQSRFTKTPLRRSGRHKTRKVVLRTLWNLDPDLAKRLSVRAARTETNEALAAWIRGRLEMAEPPADGIFRTPENHPGGNAMTADIGLVGLAVMGENLVLNMESRGFTVAVFNRTVSKVDDLLAGRGKGKKLVGAHTIPEFVASLKKPRKIMIMVKAGSPVDAVIDELVPHLEQGDILIDGGNSLFTDTIRRTVAMEAKGLRFLGVGVSGGEEGALRGPSIMPGGTREAWDVVAPIFTAISAKVGPENDIPCCAYVGPDGAGHYVKMVHNGIEYGDMQLISEAYALLSGVLNLSPDEQSAIFAEWNKGELDSFLIEITSNILKTRDPDTGKPFVDVILDKAGQKGTGAWTGQSALEFGVPAPTLVEAVFARSLSAQKDNRVAASKVLSGPADAKFEGDRTKFIAAVRDALYASKLASYAQGFQLLAAASEHYKWNIDLGRMAQLWRGGCIIRARFLDDIFDAYRKEPALANLLVTPAFAAKIQNAQAGWRWVVGEAVRVGVPVPAFSSALSYYDGYRSARVSANLLQAQRDYFGSHTFERTDKPGVFHHDWVGLHG